MHTWRDQLLTACMVIGSGPLTCCGYDIFFPYNTSFCFLLYGGPRNIFREWTMRLRIHQVWEPLVKTTSILNFVVTGIFCCCRHECTAVLLDFSLWMLFFAVPRITDRTSSSRFLAIPMDNTFVKDPFTIEMGLFAWRKLQLQCIPSSPRLKYRTFPPVWMPGELNFKVHRSKISF